MIVECIEVILEYLTIVMCMHKIVNKKFKLDRWIILTYFLVQIILILIWQGVIQQNCKLIIYIGLLLYAKKNLVDKWSKAMGLVGITVILVCIMQLLAYIIYKFFALDLAVMRYGVLSANVFVLLVIGLWKTKYKERESNKRNHLRIAIILLLFIFVFFRIVYLYNQNKYLDFEIGVQFLIETIGLIIASTLWLNAENEKKNKEKELIMYEMYTQAFEGAINTIRARQHEFDNHINAIKCLQYTIKDPVELVEAQNRYCDMVLKSNEINKLLKINFEPVIIGFIYSKIVEAKEKDIIVKYVIQPVEVKKKIPIYEFVEILGILLDNAMEALNEQSEKIIKLEIIENEFGHFSLQVSNLCRVLSNNEIEKFCVNGYSTKGKNRGVGLTRLKEIVLERKAELIVGNNTYEEQNYLAFKIVF